MGCNPCPSSPDVVGAAQQQGVANEATARLQGRMSNPNVTNPYGSQTVSWGTNPDGTPNDQPTITQTLNPQSQRIFDATLQSQQGLANLGNTVLGSAQSQLGTPFRYSGNPIQTSLGTQPGVNVTAINGGQNRDWVENGGPINKDPNLSQYGQASGDITAGRLQQQIAPSGQINTGANMGQYGYASGLAGDQYGLAQAGPAADTYGLAGAGPSANAYGLAGANVNRTPINYGSQMGKYGYAQQGTAGPNLQSQINTNGIANMPVNAGMTGQNAIMSRLTPQIQQNDQAYAAQLANQGIVQGSEAYNNAMRVHNQSNNDLLTQAALQGINLDLSANNQGYNQALQSGQFANQAAMSGFGAAQQNAQLYNAGMAQNYQQDINQQAAQNAAQNQNFNQGFGIQNLQNQAIGQNFGQGVTAQQLANQAVAQNFGQGVTAQNQANAAIGQNFNQGLQAQQLTNQAIGQNYNTATGLQQAQNAAQAQQFGQNLAQANLTNQTQGQAYGQTLSTQQLQNAAIQQNQTAALANQQAQNQAQNQQYTQNVGTNQFYNQAQNQNLSNQLASQGAYNQAQNQSYNQGLAGAQFGNTAQQQALAQQLQTRELPLNEISALMSGSQIQSPQFQGYTPAQAQAPNIYGATLQQAGMQNASQNSFNTGLFGLGAATASQWGPALATFLGGSDRNIKQDIIQVGKLPNGLNTYEFTFKPEYRDTWGHGRHIGVMADEVLKVIPEAVHRHPDGYLMVDYGRLSCL